MTLTQGMVLSPREYTLLSREYSIRLRSLFRPPMVPTYYGIVVGKESGELLAYMWFSEAREEWIIFSPESATEEVEALFS